MSEPAAVDAPLRRCRGTWLVGVVALAIYLLLPQAALHGTDWRWLVLWCDEPGAVHAQHPGYLFVAKLLRGLVPAQVATVTVLGWLSACGGAFAVAGCHRAAWHWRHDQRLADAAAVGVMFVPALLHFSTVVEMHAPFAAVMAAATAVAVRGVRSSSVRDALLAGVLGGLATLVHATGHLLVPAFALLWLAAAPRAFVPMLAMAICHVLVWAVGYALLRTTGHLPGSVAGFAAAGDPAAAQNPLEYLQSWLVGLDLSTTFGPTAVREWVAPYAPWSVLLPLAFCMRRTRRAALLLSLVLPGYLLVACVLVHAITDERGAYLLPLALPIVVLGLQLVPRRWWVVLLACGVVCGFVFRGEPGREAPDREFGRTVAAFAAQRAAVFFVADYPQMDGAHLADARLELIVARKELADLMSFAAVSPTAEQVAGWLALKRGDAAAKGACLVVPADTLVWLQARLPTFGAGWSTFVSLSKVTSLPAEIGLSGYLVE